MTGHKQSPAAWTPEAEARLKKLWGESASATAKAFGQIFGGDVNLSSWGMGRASFRDPPGGALQRGEESYSIFMPILGELHGTCLLVIPRKNADRILEILLKPLGQSLGSSSASILHSALEEIGNIALNQGSKALGEALKIEVYPSNPRLEIGSWESLWNKLAMSQLSLEDQLSYLYGNLNWGYGAPLAQYFLCLSSNSWERLRYWAQGGKPHRVNVGLGSLEVGSSPAVLKASDLGSCVALIIYDAERKTGGVAHVMLPKSPSLQTASLKPGKYADYAVGALLRRLNSDKRRLSIWIVGGADMLNPLISDLGSIGSGNAAVLKQEIRRLNLELSGEDLGGSQARSIELWTEEGELVIKSGGESRRERL